MRNDQLWFQPALTVCAALVLGLLAAPIGAVAQQAGAVSGTVIDGATNRPLADATVVVVGTEESTRTNQDGHYSTTDVLPGRVELRAILLGYQSLTQIVTVRDGATTEANFRLLPSAVSLERVVVTAVGEQAKRELGNAVASIDAGPIAEKRGITSVADLIQGRAPGVDVLQDNGITGTGMRLRIRGISSLLLTNEPLVYLDGVRIESGDDFSIFARYMSFSRLNDLNPDDIESIDIVRGPSAATLYGTEAANGVIRIVTKQGHAGRPRWNFFMDQGLVQDRSHFPDNYQGVDALGNTCLLRDVAAGVCTQADVLTFNPLENPETSLFRPGHRQQYGINVSGGSETVQYYLSGEWESEEGVMHLARSAEDTLRSQRGELPHYLVRPNTLDRFSVRANLRSQVLDNAALTASVGFVSSDTRASNGGANGPLWSGLMSTAREADDDIWFLNRPEEIFEIETKQAVERFTSSLQGSWRPFPFLSARAAFGLDETSLKDVMFQPPGGGPGGGDGERQSNSIEILQYTVDVGTSASFKLSRRVAARTSVGVQYFRNVSSTIATTGTQILPGSESISGAAVTAASERDVESRTLGSFVEQQMSLNGRLYLTAGIRMDDGNTFGSDLDFVAYPKLSASWVISEEPFFPARLLNHARLRAAWGAAGRQPGPTAGVRTFAPVAATIGGVSLPGITIQTAGNSGIKPERSEEIELGLDVLLLAGRLGLEFTYYNKHTRDALLPRTLAPSLGVGATRLENVGLVENKGAEVFINAEVISSQTILWSLAAGGSINNNTVLELCPSNPTTGVCEDVKPFYLGNQRVIEGYDPAGYWGKPILSFADDDGNGIITGNEVVLGDTAEYLGTPFPTKQATLSSNVRLFDRFELRALFEYRGGNVLQNTTEWYRCGFGVCRAANDPTAPLEEQARAAALVAPLNYTEPAWFVTLRELSLTFSAPPSWTGALAVDRMSITVAGRNLFKWHDYGGVDPEVNQFGTLEFETNDNGTLAPVRYWTARISVGF